MLSKLGQGLYIPRVPVFGRLGDFDVAPSHLILRSFREKKIVRKILAGQRPDWRGRYGGAPQLQSYLLAAHGQLRLESGSRGLVLPQLPGPDCSGVHRHQARKILKKVLKTILYVATMLHTAEQLQNLRLLQRRYICIEFMVDRGGSI